MSDLPIGVGDREAQKRFIASHEAFLREFPEIRTLFDRVFTLTLEHYNEVPTGEQETTEAQKAAETELRLAQIVVYSLARTAFDDFGDLLLLAGNGRGIGARKNLRGMYEHIVTAAFIAQNPAEATPFVEHAEVEKGKIWHRMVEANPDLTNELTPEETQDLERRYRQAQSKVKSEICKKCSQPVTQEAWTRVALDTMAAKVDTGAGTDLLKLYASCYLVPTFQSHPTAFGLQLRLEKTDTGLVYNELSEETAHEMVVRGHDLILRLLTFLNDYFQLGLDAEVKARSEMFPKV